MTTGVLFAQSACSYCPVLACSPLHYAGKAPCNSPADLTYGFAYGNRSMRQLEKALILQFGMPLCSNQKLNLFQQITTGYNVIQRREVAV